MARNVAKVYRTGELELLALRGVDFALHEAELVVLLGPSGSGKSTLLNILGGLDTPTSGRVTFRDHDLTAAIESALFRDGPAWAVFVDAGGRAGLRHVELGRRNGVSAEIAAGLAAGERVVLHPSDRVADGVRVSGRGS